MNFIPITILDNFYPNPDSLRKWALSLDYSKSSYSNYPGKRSEDLDKINFKFFYYYTRKILSLFFSEELKINFPYSCQASFQLIENFEGNGWIHQDSPMQFTSIHFLDPFPLSSSGTKIFSFKDNTNTPPDFSSIQTHHHNTGNISKENLTLKNYWDSVLYEEIQNVPNEYNRLLCFPSELPHSAGDFVKEGPRLTLTCFFKDISLKSPIERFYNPQTF